MLERKRIPMNTITPLASLLVEPVDTGAGRELLEDYRLGLSGHYDEQALRAFAVQVASLLRSGPTVSPTFARLGHDGELFFALLLERYRVGDAIPVALPWLAELPLLVQLVSDGRAEVQTVERLVLAIPNEPPRSGKYAFLQ
ncbi:hypothetical protein BH24DEI2_BH24DEI2_24890 [soil metagenome]